MPRQKPGRQMVNLRPKFISLVSKAANRREFLTRKSADGEDDPVVQVPFIKWSGLDGEDGVRYITGVVYEPDVIDTQGDCMTAAEIEKAAHRYMRDHRNIDIQHDFQPADGCWVAESTVHKCAAVIGGQTVPAGAWTLTVGIENPEIIAKIDAGELNGFSIGGVAQYVTKTEGGDDSEQPGWFRKWLKERFGHKEKAPPQLAEPAEKPVTKQEEETSMTKTDIADVIGALVETGVLKAACGDENPKKKKQGAGVCKSAEEADEAAAEAIEAPDISALVAKGVSDGMAAAFAAVQKQAAPQPAEPAEKPVAKTADEHQDAEPVDAEQLTAIIKSAVVSAVSEQVAPMQEQMNMIASAYNIQLPSNGNGTPLQPVAKGSDTSWQHDVLFGPEL